VLGVLRAASPKLAEAMTALAVEAASIHAAQPELGDQYRRPLRDLQARLGTE